MAIGPQSAHINLEQSRKQAKELVKAFKAGDKKAVDTLRWNHPRFRKLSDAEIQKGPFVLADAQLVIARLHHFESWPKLLDHIETLNKANPQVSRFERAADAIIAGDIATLSALLREHPELIRQRSTRAHHSTLLHYVSANGVEDYRQETPPNILEVTKLLLDAGAEVDAESGAYGGGSRALSLTATSAHPRAAGVQIALIDLLLERGASLEDRGGLQKLMMDALSNGCPEAAEALVSRGAHLQSIFAAAGIGDLVRVKSMYPSADRKQRESALLVAAQQGHLEVVRYLLDSGVDIAASNDMTALHNATGWGNMDVIELLLSRGAPLEALNAFGGTVLASTIWFAYNTQEAYWASRDFPGVIRRLIAAGARTDSYPEMQKDIDGVYRHAEK